ncbi:MAG: hypothetical protein DHS20C15_02410 [Planctomycetota bacterium]|nr:MAG: hypothetical protein DHS20C15_02410 [Planctomycetota bacterium]
MRAACLFPVLVLGALASAPRADDLVPSLIEAVHAEPTDPVFAGLKILLQPDALWQVPDLQGVRCLESLPDVSGDGHADFAVGRGPEVSVARPLEVRDGADGSVIWRAPAGVGFRSLRALAQRDGRLAAAATSPRGRVAVHAAATGAVLWERDLAPAALGNVTLHTVRWIDDMNADSVPDLLVAAGEGRDAGFLLSGADGTTLWAHEAGDVVYDISVLADLNADGRPEITLCGGDDSPFLTLVDGVSGAPIWSEALDGPGSALVTLSDQTDDGVPELAVGQFNAPSKCLLLIDGAQGTRIWESLELETGGVTTLLALPDLVGTGLTDIGVGSFDNAFSGVLALNGIAQWRRETSSNNGGHVFSIVDAGDLDGNGTTDVVGAAMDHQLWFVEGFVGQFLSRFTTRSRCRVVIALPDQTGDGRKELLLASSDGLTLVDGNAGLAGGPVTEVEAPADLSLETVITQWTLPSTHMLILAALGTGSFQLPAYGELGLDLDTMVTVLSGTAPGAGIAVVLLPPFPPSASGLRIYLQSASVYEPGVFGLFSEVTGFTVP